MTTKRARLTTLLILAVALLATSGCLFSPPEKNDDNTPPAVEFGSYATPDGLVDNFVTAWEYMVISEYRDNILYPGTEYNSFVFYLLPDAMDPNGEELPDSWGYDEEVDHISGLFSGNPSEDGSTPGVESISLELEPFGTWNAPSDPYQVEGDAYPEGTMARRYRTDMTITLEGENPGGYNGFLINDVIELYAIPVSTDGSTEYRLWKWRDINN